MEIVHGHVQPDLDDKHAIFPNVHFIDEEKEALELISSLNTLGYIEFDVLSNLKCLEKKFIYNSSFPCFDRCSLYAIGKHDTHGEYVVHRIYICSDLSSFVVHEHVHVEAYANNNHDLSSFSSFVLLQQIQPQEEVQH